MTFPADPTANYHRGNPQSVAAHDSIKHRKEIDLRRILELVKQRGPQRGATCDEIEELLRLSHQTASARCTEAKARGQLIDSGRRRRTRTGRAAAVLIVPVKIEMLVR